MDTKSYSYKKSFTVELILCSVCNNYHNINEVHKCSNIPKENINILEQMMENTRPKKNGKK